MGKVAVVVTVLNEQETISGLITALRGQTLPPAEVVIVDGGSTDKTWQMLKTSASKWRELRVYRHPGNRSVSRNFAVSKTTAPIIAFTDAGCIPDSTWLEELVKPFTDASIRVISGYYRGLAETTFQKCLIPYVLVMPDRVGKSEFFPSTRSMAMRRSIWHQSGGFNPQLIYNEDYAFAHHLKSLGVNFTFAPAAVVSWKPRRDLKSAASMFWRFALGDTFAGILRPKVKILTLRYFIYIFGFFLLWEINRSWLVPYVVIPFVVYSLWAVAKNYRYVRVPAAFYWLPLLQFTADGAVILGTLMGLMTRSYSK